MKKLLLPVLLTCCLNVNSQTYNAGTIFSKYYDINPDTLLSYVVYPYTHKTYGLDLFDDTAVDFLLTADGSVSPGGTSAAITLISQNRNLFFRLGRLDSVFVPAYSYWDVTKVALPLAAGDQINAPGAAWDTTLLYLTDHTGWGGGVKNVNDWIGSDKYIGLKYQSSSATTYGWIRVQCKTQDSCYIKDYSFDASPLSIQQTENPSPIIFPNPIENVFYIENLSLESLDISKSKITDIYGQGIKFTYEIKGNAVKINLDNNTPAGCYFLIYLIKDTSRIQKLIKTE
jgi:hypothetical protein